MKIAESMGIPSPSPSEQPSAKPSASGDSIAGVYIGILVVAAAFLILLRKYRNKESDKHLVDSERYFVVKSSSHYSLLSLFCSSPRKHFHYYGKKSLLVM